MKNFFKKLIYLITIILIIGLSFGFWQVQISKAAISVGTIVSAVNTNFTATVDSGANALVVVIGTHQGTISSVTYGGVAMTQVGAGCSAFNECGYVYLLLAPSVGTGTIAITRSGGSSHAAASVSLSGIKQTYTVTNTSLSSGGCGACALAITPSSNNNLIVSALGAEASVSTVSDTVIANLCNQSFECFGSQYFQQTTAASKTMTFNLSSGQRAGVADVAFEPLSTPTSTQQTRVIITTGRVDVLKSRLIIPGN